MAADFHLVVDPPEKFQRAIRHTAHQIAGAVEPCAIGLHKPLGGQVGALPIAVCHPCPADPQLAFHQIRQSPALGGAHGECGIGNRCPQWDLIRYNVKLCHG